ncbi:MAG: methyltransferase, partial [Spirochaetales bacterium]|nr:methyltransferase [Spirochaetales bacterium]
MRNGEITGRERLLNSINHRSGPLTMDLGGTVVSGVHVSVVAALRDFYGLPTIPVKVIEPYQMLGEVDSELKAVIGADIESVLGPATMFGFRNEGWKEWQTPWDQDVLVPADFQVDKAGSNYQIYPKGDRSAKPSGRMPGSGYYFDSIIRQDHFDENKLEPADNLQEFDILDGAAIDHYASEAMRARATGKGVTATMPGTGLGDIALVPGPFLTDPKGIRDVTEWY